MDSFYDAPRGPPAPIPRETLVAVPVVPEISVLCPSNAPRNAFTPYNQWKHQQNNFFGPNKENVGNYMRQPQNSSILKKQVRFEGPGLQQALPDSKKVDFAQNFGISTQNNGLRNNSIQTSPSFEQMYMANIPNRQLDLSVIDLPKTIHPNNTKDQINSRKNSLLEPKTQSKEKEAPKTYKEFLEAQKNTNNLILNDSVTDIFNYKRNSDKMDGLSPKVQPISHIRPLQELDPISRVSNDQDNYFQSVSQAISQRPVETVLERHNSNQKVLKAIRNDTGSDLKEYAMWKQRNNYQNEDNNILKNVADADYHKFDTELETHTKQSCGCCKRSYGTSQSTALKPKSDDDFTAKDLLKIIAQQSQQIAQQNTQLLLLQQQVSELVLMHKNNATSNQKSVESCQAENNIVAQTVQDRYITSTQHEMAKVIEPNVGDTPRKNKNHLPNFSIGLTTSFEVSFRRPPYKNQNEYHQKNTKLLGFEPEPPRIQEITETESTRSDGNCQSRFHDSEQKLTLVDNSMVFREPIKVREQCPSPEPSIKINMNDFDDSDTDDDEASNSEASFYRNLMGQVNKILQKAQIETAEGLAYNMAGTNLNNKTIHKVKEATLKHLRRIGVDLPNIEENSQNSSLSDDTKGKSYDHEDISFAVKQLLMKYLPADHLAKLAAKEKQDGGTPLTPKEKIGVIKNRPEFSFATVQYMKKYNLIENHQKDFNQHQRQHPSQSPKILDISKLKQQPKLL